jgi:hypothetical protein
MTRDRTLGTTDKDNDNDKEDSVRRLTDYAACAG